MKPRSSSEKFRMARNIALVVAVAYAAFSMFFGFRATQWRTGCASQLKAIGQSLAQYASDYDKKLPPARIGGPGSQGLLTADSRAVPFGWADALYPYTRSTAVFQCPAALQNKTSFPAKSGYTPYWLNSWASGAKTTAIISPTETLLVGEGHDGKDLSNASYSKGTLPPQWIADKRSPAYRHSGGANYLMGDGSVHHLKPGEVLKFSGGKNGFALH